MEKKQVSRRENSIYADLPKMIARLKKQGRSLQIVLNREGLDWQE
jgi:hypothetical protein